MTDKRRKRNVTIRLPQWACDILNAEADIYDEKWLALSAAIQMWHEASPDQKAYYARRVREQEIEESRQRDIARRGGQSHPGTVAQRIIKNMNGSKGIPVSTDLSTPQSSHRAVDKPDTSVEPKPGNE